MKTLQLGSIGPSVQLLQLALVRAGYAPLATDGIFGSATQYALRRFQQSSALAPDGVAGALTHRALLPWYTGFAVCTVSSGDTLFSVAERYGTTVSAILTANTVPRNNELAELPSFIEYAAESGVDAFIITDIGVLKLAKKYAPDVDIHISTQAGITNYAAANAFYELGANRIVTARELSLAEIAELRAKTPKELEIECFVHGAMCVSFSEGRFRTQRRPQSAL